MPSLILVRHGQASFGTGDYDHLSPVGFQQAAIVAGEFASRGLAPDRLISGSLRRQRQTAEPIAAQTGLTATVDERWNEYRGDDLLAAHTSSDARLDGDQPISSRAFQAILEDGLRAWAEADDATTAEESWPAFRSRVDAAVLETVTALGSGQTAVVATSAGTIAAAATTLLGGTLETFLRLNRVGINAGLTTVVSGASGQTLLNFNDHAHLQRADGLITFR